MIKPTNATEVENLLAQGEGECVDFKHSITNTNKIARAMVAFANHKGGHLLIGVKDNGRPAKINCEEEAFMVESALAKAKPALDWTLDEVEVAGKTILDLYIAPGKSTPYRSCDEDGVWRAYVRTGDANVRAHWVWEQWAKKRHSSKGNMLTYSGLEERIIKLLAQHDRLTQEEIAAGLTAGFRPVGHALLQLVLVGVVGLAHGKESTHFRLLP
jgi:hypothetical protein